MTDRVRGVDWDFSGTRLDYGWMLALAYYVGFRKRKGAGMANPGGLVKMVAIGSAESGRWTGAWNRNYWPDDSLRSIDRGVFQIGSVHDDILPPAKAYDPIPNARTAFVLSNGGTDFSDWAVYNNRSPAYRAALETATWFHANGTGWRARVDRVEEELGA